MEYAVLIIRLSWLLTAIASIHIGLGALGYDLCEQFHGPAMKIINIIFGIAGVISLVAFFMY